MDKEVHIFKKFLYTFVAFAAIIVILHIPIQICPEMTDTEPLYKNLTAHVCAYLEVDDTDGMDVPVPMPDRVYNRNGQSCVFCSLSLLGRYNEIESLCNLIDQKEYQHPSGPGGAKSCLDKYHVKFIQITNKDYKFLEKYVHEEHRPVLFDVPHHAMVVIDYHTDKVHYINNSDKTLSVREMSMQDFRKRWGGWALVMFNEPDIIPFKMNPWRNIPIDGQEHQPEFFPVP